MRKPSAALWVVNQLSRRAPDQVKALVDATQRMRRAHGKSAGDELRDAMREQHAAAQALRLVAEEAAREIDADASPGLLRRVQETAQAAAVSDPASLRAGTLAEELGPSGFDALVETEVGAPPLSHERRGPAQAPVKASAAQQEEQRRRRRVAERAAKELREAERAASDLSAKSDKADQRARQARKAAEAAQEAAVAARRRADEAAERASAIIRRR